MVESPDPVWARFGAEVRKYRRQSGMTLDGLAKRVRVSPQMVGAMERGTRRTRKDIAEQLEGVFATSGALLRQWADASRSADHPHWHTDVVKAEEEASEIHYFHPTLIPGILQTEAYARVIFQDGRPLDSPGEIDRLTRLRVGRLAALLDTNAPKLTAVVGEGAVRAPVGSRGLMCEQLEHIESLAGESIVRFLVVPSATAYHGGASGPFQLLRFAQRPPIVYADHAGGGAFIDDSEDVQRFTAVLQELLAWALSPDLTIDLLRKVRSDNS
ncbi:helix-turn-helix domain-containing protein [Nocardiopsis halophila]|uniref:helix-turn-helix domain-containing protein n=1 Tax=Nocardiopsis halophila TaxID=141692 RepID=UPI0004756CEA|nr:helix-turn-helix transcriptional regulator [Nocardiopsis halophila]